MPPCDAACQKLLLCGQLDIGSIVAVLDLVRQEVKIPPDIEGRIIACFNGFAKEMHGLIIELIERE